MITMRDGSTPADPRLGRVAEFDPKSKLFPVSNKLKIIPATTRTRKTWPLNLRLNQLQTPKCVGNAFAHEYAAGPDTHRVNQDLASEWYRQAQDRDQWAGSDYEGSSTSAAVRLVSTATRSRSTCGASISTT
jgi:hypothetical protein